MSNPNGSFKTLNSGWPVWGNNPTSKRNLSVSSATSLTDQSSTTARSESWTSSRPTSGVWEDESTSPAKKDNAPLDSSILHASMQRQNGPTLSVGRMDERPAGAKSGRYSPQGYDNVKEANTRYASSTSPTAGAFDTLPGSGVDTDLSLALRGMVVADDYSGQARAAGPPSPIRIPPPMTAHRPYGVYSPADYGGYYANPATRESYMDYPYGLQSVPPSPISDMHRQQAGLYYDYSGGRGNQYYYPMYTPPTPMLTPTSAPSTPATYSDKKREMQLNIQQGLTSPGMMRSTPSSPVYPRNTMEYSSGIPMMITGSNMYSQPAMYAPLRHGRHRSIALRSALLDEFRANKARKWELRDIFGYIVEFSGDQHGSRFIQQKLETASTEEKQIVFDEIVPDNALQLIQDVFGNYVIQKLFEHGTQVQKTVLASTMEGHILPLSLQMYGCRVVQKAIECILPEQQGAFVRELEAHVLKCVKDANGNHVIQKLIERVPADRLQFVSTFRGNVYDLSTHPYGCRVLQRSLEHLPHEMTFPLMDELHKYVLNLAQDQFGNYVVQFVIEHGSATDKALVLNQMRGQILALARHKFASNVCEKALVFADVETRAHLIDEIMMPTADGVSPLVIMMKDQFANYVLQRALATAEGEQKDMLIAKVKPHIANMRRYSSAYSKHLVAVERLLNKQEAAVSGSPLHPQGAGRPVDPRQAHDSLTTIPEL